MANNTFFLSKRIKNIPVWVMLLVASLPIMGLGAGLQALLGDDNRVAGGTLAAGAILLGVVFYGWLFRLIFVGVRYVKENRAASRDLAYRKMMQPEWAMKARYDDALAELRRTKSADARIAALEAGRQYLTFLRAKYSGDAAITIFDEIALKNDIDAYGSGEPDRNYRGQHGWAPPPSPEA